MLPETFVQPKELPKWLSREEYGKTAFFWTQPGKDWSNKDFFLWHTGV
jgi:hypothetical protein